MHFIDTLGAGGSERQLVYLLQNLDRERFESSVVTTYDEFRHYETELQQLGVKIYSLRHGSLRIVNRSRGIARYIGHVWNLRPQIVHSWLHYPNLIARIARPFCPPHHLITAIRSEYSLREIASETRTAWLSDFRVVIDRENKINFGSKPKLGKPITVEIPNAIAQQFFNLSHSKTSHKNKFNILMVSRIDPRKDHQTLLKAVNNSEESIKANLEIIFIGEVTNIETLQQINKIIAEFDLESIVKLLPATNNIIPYYQTADICILPSSSEAFPNVVLESLATGTPIIVSEAANLNKLIQDGVNGWTFPTRNSIALAKCLRAAWETSPEQRARIGEHGRATARHYTIEKMVRQYEQLYERALSRS